MGKEDKKTKVKKPFYKRWWFIGIVLIIVISAIGGGGDDETVEEPQETASSEVEENQDSQEPKQEESNETIEIVDYEVVKKDDISFGNTKRYGWEVVVKEPATVEQLKEVAKKVVEEAKNDKKFNALAIGFYDYAEFIGYGYVLGKVEYAPDGDWAKADTVRAGQYDKMDYKYDLREKDWSKQLSKEEVEVFKAWHELYDSKTTASTLPDEEEIKKEIAKKFNMEEDEVYNIMMKQSTWMFDDNQ